jgi:hypothetical protein
MRTNVDEPHAPGEKPSAARYIYNWLIEYAPFENDFYLATSWKKPVTRDFTDPFLFLTDAEIDAIIGVAGLRREETSRQ